MAAAKAVKMTEILAIGSVAKKLSNQYVIFSPRVGSGRCKAVEFSQRTGHRSRDTFTSLLAVTELPPEG